MQDAFGKRIEEYSATRDENTHEALVLLACALFSIFFGFVLPNSRPAPDAAAAPSAPTTAIISDGDLSPATR